MGKYRGGNPPFGYDVKDGELVANPREQLAIKFIKESQQLGGCLGSRRLAKLLESNTGIRISHMTVKRILDRN